MFPFRTVLFDLDGTLIDAFTTIYRSYVHTLPLFGFPAPTREQVRAAVGGGLDHAMARFVPPDLVPAAVQEHIAFSKKILTEDVRLMPGGRELLEALVARGVACAVLTNKLGSSARTICDHLGVTPLLRGGVYGAKDTPWLKPERALSEQVLAALQADRATTCLLGDSPFDVQTGKNAGFACWCVTTGTHTAEELRAAGAERVVETLLDVRRALED